MATASKKSITISLGGTEVPVYLPDGSHIVIKVTTSTTAGAAAVAIRREVSTSWRTAQAAANFHVWAAVSATTV